MRGLGGSALLASSALVALDALPAVAQSRSIDIPAQSVESAVTQLGQQAGVQIIAARRFTHGKITNAVRGNLTVQQALFQMLDGSGLSVRQTGPQTFAIVAMQTAAAQEPDRPTRTALMLAQATPMATATDSPPPLVDAGAASTPGGGAGIPDIIVTATRQAQNVQKVSTAVTVIDGASIKTQALTNVGQIFSNLPSIQATAQPGGFSIDVRGLGGDLPAGSTQGSVALVADGVYNINSQSTAVGFFDVNRIEVLAGPQSTRYGPNADGGVVNLVTNDPILGKFSGTATFTAGNYNLFRGEAAVNIPLGDTLAIRLAGAAVSRSSYFDPAEGNNKAQSFRGKILWKPDDKFSLKLTYQLDHVGGTGNGSNVFPVFTNKVPVYSGGSINDLSNPWGQSPSNPVNENHANIYSHTIIGNASYAFSDALALDALLSYSKLTGGEKATIYLPPWSTSAANGPVFTDADLHEFNPFHQLTGELRLHNGPGSRVQWNLGYYHWDYLEAYSADNAAFLSQPPQTTTTATNAVYGEITYPVTDRFRLIAGARESFDHRTFEFNNAGTITRPFDINFHHFDYRGGFEYDVAPHSMIYFTASSAYRPGGLSALNPVTGSPNSFKSEVNHAYEVGTKNRFFNNTVQLNADLFYYDMSNYQNLDKYTGFVPPEGGAICNNGDPRAGCQTPTFGLGAHSLGVEAQLRANVTPDDVVTLTGTYVRAIFNHKQGTCATVAAPTGGCYDGYNSETPNDPGAPFFYLISGSVQPHSPKFSANFSYFHTFRFQSGAKFVVGGDGFYTTGYWVNPVLDATRYGYQPKYWLGNVSMTFTPASEKFSVSGWVRNVSSYAVKQSVLPAQSIGDPRTFGGTVSFHW